MFVRVIFNCTGTKASVIISYMKHETRKYDKELAQTLVFRDSYLVSQFVLSPMAITVFSLLQEHGAFSNF
jgi:hypothetical protein